MTPESRERCVVLATKIPAVERDVAGPVLAEPEAGYEDVWNSRDDEGVPVQESVAYVAYLTSRQIEEFRAASNCEDVAADVAHTVDQLEVQVIDAAAEERIPDLDTLRWLGADVEGWDGEGTICAVLDGGTSTPVRARMGVEVVASRNFTSETLTDGITNEHGCLVTPDCLPSKTRLLEGVVGTKAGVSWSSWFAAGVRWAVDNHAQVINYSYSGGGASSVQLAVLRYAHEHGVLVCCSAGNEGLPQLGYPSAYCRELESVISSIAHDVRTNRIASWSNRHRDGTGCAPGVGVVSLNAAGQVVRWSGTSVSAPLMVYLLLMLLSGGRYSVAAAVAALRATARDTLEPPDAEGGGAWHFGRALEFLQARDPVEPRPEVPPEVISDEPLPLRDPPGCWAQVRRALFGG